MPYLRHIALIFAVTAFPGLVRQADAFSGSYGDVASTSGKAGRGPAVRRHDGTLVLSERRLRRLEAIDQKLTRNSKKKDWAERKYYRELSESGGVHLKPNGKSRLSLLGGSAFGLPLAGLGITGGGFGLLGLAHIGTFHTFLTTGTMGVAALGSAIFTTGGLAGVALLTAGVVAAVGVTVGLAGAGMRFRASRVTLPHQNQVDHYVKRLLAGESPHKLMKTRPEDAPGPEYAPGPEDGRGAGDQAARQRAEQVAKQKADLERLAAHDPAALRQVDEEYRGVEIDPELRATLDELIRQQSDPEGDDLEPSPDTDPAPVTHPETVR